jgi:dCTP deaminase
MNIAENNDCERLFFEVLERTLRFWSHVKGSCEQAARPNRRRTAQETIARTLTTGLAQILESLVKVYNDESGSEEERIELLHLALQNLAELHGGPLSAVPRPHEPIELVSYIRQALNSNPDREPRSFSPPHVFATEVLGDQAHSRFDQVGVNNFKMTADLTMATKHPEVFGKLIEEYLSGNVVRKPSGHASAIYEPDNDKDRAIGFISLPRVDLANPLRWPSLIHETGHFESAAGPDSLWEAFTGIEGGIIATQAKNCMEQYLIKINCDPLECSNEIRKWLMECWCDAHAARVAGAPALFSQMHAFLFSTPCYLTEPAHGRGYPPAWFRLRLMRALITTRYSQDNPSNKLINAMISDEWVAMERLFPPSKNADIRGGSGDLRNLFLYFHQFLTKQFPQDKWLDQSEINPTDLSELIEDLSNGLPIPTHRNFFETKQTRASHAEILLAGWSYRNKEFKQSLFKIIQDDNFKLQSALPQLMAIVDRADASLQMSIQVSEWFGILEQPIDRNIVITDTGETSAKGDQVSIAGLLTDHEIVDLLVREQSLRIIPLIGGTSGIEGTTVDIRLGHNFEIFFTNISGAMDALNRNRRNVVDSMEVDYDSLDGLEIAPGQFVLGHTLEYLKLPPDVAAEVNGRSSFARLGIEVHMTAPFVEAGFDGCLTFEISNSGHSTVKLYPGMRIAQLRFYRCTSKPKVSYGDRPGVKYRGRLRHNKTEQFNDWEIDAFNAEKDRRKVS